MFTKTEEKQLIKDCLRNDRQAQNKLYKQFAGQMMSLCMRYSSSRAEAEDVLQDGFFLVFRDMKQFKGEGPLGGWIRRVMVNTALRAIRKKKNLYPILELDQVRDTVSGSAEIYSQLGTQELMELIQELPSGAKTVFNLYVVEAYTHKEIADLLQVSEGTSKSQLARAKKLLKEKMRQYSIGRTASGE